MARYEVLNVPVIPINKEDFLEDNEYKYKDYLIFVVKKGEKYEELFDELQVSFFTETKLSKAIQNKLNKSGYEFDEESVVEAEKSVNSPKEVEYDYYIEY